MKKILLAFALLISLGISAQVRVNPGFRAGVSLADLTDIEGKRKADFYAGAFANIKLTRWYALQPELTYARQGSKVRFYDNFDPSFGSTTEKLELNYLGITINNKFTPVAGLNLNVGPYLDFLVDHSNFVNPQNDVDSGVTLGLGYTFKNGIGVEARYKIGFIDVFQDYADDDFYNDYLIVNNAFQIGLTYTFNLKK
ncbi:porin family protein [Flavobacterium sp.]|uniref:porin family protein n=1 Tax=Flavobacterium sp. TaxID=239 RepID=UPI00120C1E12|nr:porin family protein [Flavobacterium sp.]RZJ72529.1 MAG: PorT family protein [Flavobacterium sp.]